MGDHEVMDADLVISFRCFVNGSPAALSCARGQKDRHRISDGPFKYMKSNWGFEDIGDDKCKIHFFVDFEFKNAILQKIIGVVFNEGDAAGGARIRETRRCAIWRGGIAPPETTRPQEGAFGVFVRFGLAA